MSNAKKHHYVPQSYIVRFLSSGKPTNGQGKTWALNKANGKIGEYRISEIAVIRDFYKVDEVSDPLFFEKLLAEHIEPATKDAISLTLEVIDSHSQLYYPSKILLARYMAYQLARMPEFREEQIRVREAIANTALRTASLLGQSVEGLRAQSMYGSAHHIRDAFAGDHVDKIQESLMKHFWRILKAPRFTNFISSDSPIVSKHGGLEVLGNEILFPLSPEYLLYLVDYRTSVEMNSDLTGKEGGVIEASEEVVHWANSLQILNSRYFSYSPTKRFSFLGELRMEFLDYFSPGKSRFVIEIEERFTYENGKLLFLDEIQPEEGVSPFRVELSYKDLPFEQAYRLVCGRLQAERAKHWRKSF